MKVVTPELAALLAEYVRTHWTYNPETGVVSGRGGRPIGKKRKDGGLDCTVRFPDTGVVTAVLLHRAAWLLKTGEWPVVGIDHKDGDRSNNRWLNIRDATQSQNRQNLKGVSAKGVLRGCTPYYRKWKAQIKAPDGKHHYLGLFPTQEEAHAAYCKAKLELHPFQPVQRQPAEEQLW